MKAAAQEEVRQKLFGSPLRLYSYFFAWFFIYFFPVFFRLGIICRATLMNGKAGVLSFPPLSFLFRPFSFCLSFVSSPVLNFRFSSPSSTCLFVIFSLPLFSISSFSQFSLPLFFIHFSFTRVCVMVCFEAFLSSCFAFIYLVLSKALFSVHTKSKHVTN